MGSGIGVTPILSLANTLASEPGDVSILYRVSDITSAPLLDDLEAIAKERGHRLHVEAGPRGKGGVFSLESDNEAAGDRLRMLQLFPNLHESDVYLCGPQAWTDRVIETLDELGVAKQQIHVEEFAW
jgi:ferredoxin-NADP reductase